MKITLDPVEARPEFALQAEQEILAYFRETIFEPLRAILGTSRRNEELDDWKKFPTVWDSMGIPRCDMPQVHTEDRGLLAQYLERQESIRHVEEFILPRELKPTQDEVSDTKVEAARNHTGDDRAILVSQDGHIVDGHHQWAAAMLDHPERLLRIWRFDTQIIPLLAAVHNFPRTFRQNEEKQNLIGALLAGTVYYINGQFLGAFNSTISKELRALNAWKVPGGFSISPGLLTQDLRDAIATVKVRNYRLHTQISDTLGQMALGLAVAATGITFANTVDKLWADLQKQFVRSVSKVEGLTEPQPLPDEVKEELKAQMTAGTNLSIKNFTAESTATLRAKVQQNLARGGRADQLARIVESEFGVAKRKATVIADAEISLATAAYRQSRYESMGITHYRWQTMGDSKVRPTHGESNNHRVLNGRIFAWSDPPVVDVATGRRRHPGQDYGPCRCLARPILDLT